MLNRALPSAFLQMLAFFFIFLKRVLQEGDIVRYLLWRDFTVKIAVIAIPIKSKYLEYFHLEKRRFPIAEDSFCSSSNIRAFSSSYIRQTQITVRRVPFIRSV